MDEIHITAAGKPAKAEFGRQFHVNNDDSINAIRDSPLPKDWYIEDPSTSPFSSRTTKISNTNLFESVENGKYNIYEQSTALHNRKKTVQAISPHEGANSSNAEASDKWRPCSVCDEMFSCKTALGNHLKMHSQEEKPYICKDCHRSFKQISNLIQHRRIHTGERPYRCSFCEKSFKQKSQVMQHERLHTGEKPYVCSYCPNTFVQLSQLKYHEKRHKGKDAAGDDKYIKNRRGRKKMIQQKAQNYTQEEVNPVYILTEQDIASGTFVCNLKTIADWPAQLPLISNVRSLSKTEHFITNS